MIREIVVVTLVFLAGITVVLNFMPGSLTGDEELIKVVAMCDSVFVNDDDEIVFSIRNMSDELFYIDRDLDNHELGSLREKCSQQVVTLMFYEPGLIANALQNSHRITKVERNSQTIYSSETLRKGLTPR
jgi:hypothetical protein